MQHATAETMHPTQTAYIIARAALDAAYAAQNAAVPAPGPDATEEAVEAWLDESEAAHSMLGIDALFSAVDAAERAMLAWSFQVARSECKGRGAKAKLATIAEIEAGIERPLGLTIRRKAIDLALRLAA